MKHYEKEFQVAGVTLKLKKLGLTEFPAFKVIYAEGVDSGDAVKVANAYSILFSWLQYEVLGEWVAAFDKKTGEFRIEVLNDPAHADKILDILLSEVLTPLFLNTAESTK